MYSAKEVRPDQEEDASTTVDAFDYQYGGFGAASEASVDHRTLALQQSLWAQQQQEAEGRLHGAGSSKLFPIDNDTVLLDNVYKTATTSSNLYRGYGELLHSNLIGRSMGGESQRSEPQQFEHQHYLTAYAAPSSSCLQGDQLNAIVGAKHDVMAARFQTQNVMASCDLQRQQSAALFHSAGRSLIDRPGERAVGSLDHREYLQQQHQQQQVLQTETSTPRPRWCPTQEQIQILESLFNSGTTTPTRDMIVDIATQLRKYGNIAEANVFYWFQNRKARAKRKLQPAPSKSCDAAAVLPDTNKSLPPPPPPPFSDVADAQLHGAKSRRVASASIQGHQSAPSPFSSAHQSIFPRSSASPLSAPLVPPPLCVNSAYMMSSSTSQQPLQQQGQDLQVAHRLPQQYLQTSSPILARNTLGDEYPNVQLQRMNRSAQQPTGWDPRVQLSLAPPVHQYQPVFQACSKGIVLVDPTHAAAAATQASLLSSQAAQASTRTEHDSGAMHDGHQLQLWDELDACGGNNLGWDPGHPQF